MSKGFSYISDIFSVYVFVSQVISWHDLPAEYFHFAFSLKDAKSSLTSSKKIQCFFLFLFLTILFWQQFVRSCKYVRASVGNTSKVFP